MSAGAAVPMPPAWTRRTSRATTGPPLLPGRRQRAAHLAPRTAEDVAAEVRQLIEVLGRDGGYILGPSHAIQAGTPPENIVALFDTAASH